jgi:hypothetical protein
MDLMEREELRKYRDRWQRVNEVVLAERHGLSPETKLKQCTWLLRTARRLGWELRPPEGDIQNWELLRARLGERQS